MSRRLYRVIFSGHRYIIEAENANQIKAWVNEQIGLRIGNPSAQHMREYLEEGKEVIALPQTDEPRIRRGDDITLEDNPDGFAGMSKRLRETGE